MKGVREILLAAADLLTDERWIKGNSSLDAEGREIYPDVKDACRWCTDGALKNIATDFELYDMARLQIMNILGEKYENLEDWNDEPGRTAEDVRKLLRQAAQNYQDDV